MRRLGIVRGNQRYQCGACRRALIPDAGYHWPDKSAKANMIAMARQGFSPRVIATATNYPPQVITRVIDNPAAKQ